LGNNFINIEGNGIVHTIVVTKHLDSNTKCPKVLLCQNFVNGFTYEEEDMLLVAEPDLFITDTITLSELKILVVMVTDAKIGIVPKIDFNAKIGNDEKINIDPKIGIDMKININKLIFYFPHTPREILVDTMPT
jgi:hypothetical protein